MDIQGRNSILFTQRHFICYWRLSLSRRFNNKVIELFVGSLTIIENDLLH